MSMRSFSIALAALVAAPACSGDSTSPDARSDNFDRAGMLDHLGRTVLLPMQARFAAAADGMPAAIGAYCDALDAGAVGTTLDEARAAWGAAIDAWQPADAMLVGPAAMDQKTLRDRIYAWPLIQPCQLDRDTVTRWNDPASYDITTKLANARSLLAVEYLLFTTATTHSCVATPAGWDALAANLPRARCRLAQAIATDVAAQGRTLVNAWEPTGGDFVGQLANAGRSGSMFPSAQAAVNEISDAMFYVDRMVKDMKLAEPAGIAMNACGSVEEICEREIELRLSDRGSFAIRANLRALREVVTGKTETTDGLGFDDFLREVGSSELADKMVGDLDDAIAKADALPDSYLAALTTDRPGVVAAHAAVKLFTNELKSQFLTVLSLEIPDDVATDND